MIELCKYEHILGKDVWAWSGHQSEELLKNSKARELLENCDVLVDGRYEDELRDLSLAWRGSSNQRVLDVKKSLMQNKPVSYKGELNGR